MKRGEDYELKRLLTVLIVTPFILTVGVVFWLFVLLLVMYDLITQIPGVTKLFILTKEGFYKYKKNIKQKTYIQ